MTPEMPGPPPSVEALVESRFASEVQSSIAAESSSGSDSQFKARSPLKTPSKSRSFSDSAPQLSPSPKFREPSRVSRDDHTIPSNPQTPKRPDFIARGLSLQVPLRDAGITNAAAFAHRVPLSPQLDARNTYASPASVLPRRSRGAEFTRACTNLHHSTLADQSSPDSSPTITQKGMTIPGRSARSNSMAMDSPNVNPTTMWPAMGNPGRSTAPSSVGSINMLGSDSSSSDSDEGDPMDPDDNDDPMLMTPQATKPSHVNTTTPGGGWANIFSPSNIPSLMRLQRARLGKARNSRKSSSSASGHSSLASPGPSSPPPGKGLDNSGGYFAREAVIKNTTRRESLSIFTRDLHISSGNDSGDEGNPPMPATPNVVRRPVNRRGNLLPKSRQFGRIRAELLEEAAPIDSEVRREAEIIRQVRESDEALPMAQSSPTILPSVPDLDGPLEGVPEEEPDNAMSIDGSTKGVFAAFNINPGKIAGRAPWGQQEQAQTPPPPVFPRASSSTMSEDVNMDSPSVSSASNSVPSNTVTSGTGWLSRSSTPQPMAPISAAEGLKKSNKRRRDDDLDGNSIKRRAVSPGVSVQNSPILSQSPGQRDGGLWGSMAKASREGSVSGPSTGANVIGTPSLGPKRIGLQGMTDASDGFMKMSIE